VKKLGSERVIVNARAKGKLRIPGANVSAIIRELGKMTWKKHQHPSVQAPEKFQASTSKSRSLSGLDHWGAKSVVGG
jgi:hypothetical protein